MVAPTAYELICHNDWSPWNALMRSGRIEVMLDWDLAGPGTRLWDIASAVFDWTPLFIGYKYPKIDDRCRRLRLFVDAYGLDDRSELLLTLRLRMQHMTEFVEAEARAGDVGMQRLVDPTWSKRRADELAYLDANWAALERAL
jgi:Ser/Thr protein kinase RdoA (MazF antagonist)